jgi:hypothetical protein
MSYTKNILLDRTMQAEAFGFGTTPAVPSAEEAAQIEREQQLTAALESIHTMKEFWQSGDRVKMAFAMKFCSDVQEWLNYLYFDSDFLSFGSDEGFASPEPDYNNLARELDDRMWEVCHA